MAPADLADPLTPHTCAVVGCGGLGVPAAWTLALAGVRRLVLIDTDVVELSNLHRQVLYDEADLGQAKADCLAAHLRTRFPACAIETRQCRLDAGNVDAVLAGCTAVVEGSDDAICKFVVNDWAFAALPRNRTASIAAAIGRRAQWMVVEPAGACYRCLFEEPPPAAMLATCQVAGVLGPVVGLAGAMAARALVRSLRDEPDPARSALVRVQPDGWHRTRVPPAADCPCQSHR